MKSWHLTFLKREFSAGSRQLFLFMLCVFLASLSLSVVSGWRQSVDTAMAEETRKGAGGDVVAFSTEPFSDGLLQAAEPYGPIFTSEMFTVSLAPSTERTLFSKLKTVEPGYPYYGEVPLQSGRDLHQALEEGPVVEARVLERLGIAVGDELKIGNRVFRVADVALSEPDRPLGMWGVSPRIFLADTQLDSTGLLRPGSYLERRIHIKLEDPARAGEVAETLRQAAVPDQERVETWERPPVNMERYVDNFFTFLDMMAVLAVTLGGLGMQSTLSAWLRGRTSTVAVARTLGASGSFVLRHYTAIVLAAAVLGYLLGLGAAGYLLQVSGDYLSGMLPIKVTPALSPAASAESAGLCLLVALSFAAWPLYEINGVRPATVLRQETATTSIAVRLAFALFLLFALFALLAFLVSDLVRAFWMGLGLSAVGAVTALLSNLLIRLLKGRKAGYLPLRVALGSWRSPEARTELVVFILSTCLAVLYSAIICEEALRQSWVEAMPPDTPNLILLDIQPAQLEEVQNLVVHPMSSYRNMRVRVQAVNGSPLDRSGKREYWQRDGRGKLDALPTLEIPSNDELVNGESLYQGDRPDQVSVRKDIAEGLGLKLGDRVTFGIQGIPVEATVSSIRTSRREGFKPRFELLFPPALVEGAPSNAFATLRVPEQEIGELQTRLARAFPSVVSMDLSLTIRLIAERLSQMVGLVRYFLASGIAAGALVLISAVWSARERRAREAAYYKVMGADSSFLARVNWLENGLLGLATALIGLGLALAVSWSVCRFKLDIPFPELGGALGWMIVVPVVAITLLGWLVSRNVVATRPAPHLREE